MKFLSDSYTKSMLASASVISTIKANVAGMEKARCHKTVHASDVTKDGFCPRKLALLDVHDKTLPDQYIPVYLRTTFDMGHAVSDLVREKWLGEAAVGHWHCMKCNATKYFSPRPPAKGKCTSGNHRWTYDEVMFRSMVSGIEGSIDVLVRLGGPKLWVTELKIMAPDAFNELVAPLAEHRLRTSLYLRLVEESDSVYKSSINTEQGRILYVSRGAGKKHPEFHEVMPFKEFVVDRNDKDTEAFVKLGLSSAAWTKEGKLPAGICKVATDKHATGCPMKKQCFSGDFPAGTVHPKNNVVE